MLYRDFDWGAFYEMFCLISTAKKVLPAIVPEMSYDGLDIKNGDQAIVAFVRMARDDIPEKEVANTRKRLLEYCCQDTMAMLVIHKKLFLLDE